MITRSDSLYAKPEVNSVTIRRDCNRLSEKKREKKNMKINLALSTNKKLVVAVVIREIAGPFKSVQLFPGVYF